jgi:glycine/D-amino acid oxidase-like deaminating enzyme
VLDDKTAGVIAAERTIGGLRKILPEMGVAVLENTRVLAIDPVADPVVLDTERGRFEAGRVVVTAGPWAARLLPRLASRLQVIRQTVTYWALDDAVESSRLGRFPVWVYLGVGSNETYYGLPSFGEPGIKAARFVHDGVSHDPDRLGAAAAADDVERVRRLLGEQLRPKIGDLVKSETCYFTNTESEDYILDEVAADGRVVVGAGLSGHGFKLAPLSGRILAGLAMGTGTGVAAFEATRARFRVDFDGT